LACLPLIPSYAGTNTADDDEFLREIKIRSRTSFGAEVKPSVPRRKILLMLKQPYRYEKRYFVVKIHIHLSPSYSCFAARCVCWLLSESSGG
jgi:hypothetical protein